MHLPEELVTALAAYLLPRAPFDPDARGLYNSIIVEANKAPAEGSADVGGDDPAE